MKTNSILEEIRHTREHLFAEAGSDVARFFAMMRERQAVAKARGAVVIPASRKPRSAVCEEPSEYPPGTGSAYTNPILAEIRQAREDLMAEAGGDLNRFFEMVRERETVAKERGVVFVPVPQPRETAP